MWAHLISMINSLSYWDNKPSIDDSVNVFRPHLFQSLPLHLLMTINPGLHHSYLSFSLKGLYYDCIALYVKSLSVELFLKIVFYESSDPQQEIIHKKKKSMTVRFRIILFYMCVECVDDVFVFIILPHKYVKSRIRPLKGLLSEIKPPLAASRLFLLSDDPEYLMRPRLSCRIMVWIITTNLQRLDPFIFIINLRMRLLDKKFEM